MAKAKAKKQQFETIEPKDVHSGMQIRVHQKIKDINAKGQEKERIQVFEGLVLSRKHGNEPGATFTVRKVSEGVGVEKTFPIHSPLIEKIELVDQKLTNRAKLYYTRNYKKRLKSISEKKITLKKGEKPGEPKKTKTSKSTSPKTEEKKPEIQKETVQTEKK